MVLPSPKFSEPQSSVQSQRSSAMWRRSTGPQIVPAPLHWRFARSHIKIAAHASGQVDDDFLVLGADAFHDFLVEVDAAGALSSLWVAHMAMDHSRAGSSGFER
jgi:hypothetical protein